MKKKTASAPIKRRGRFSPSRVLTYILLSAWGITTVYPFLWVIINSFRLKGEIRSDSFSIPWPWTDSFTLDNYHTAADRSDFVSAYTNSLLVSLAVTVVVIVLAGLAAYGLVRYNFRGKKLVYGLVIASMMFPIFSTIIPVFRLEAMMGIASTGNRWLALLSVILPQIAGNLSFSIIVLILAMDAQDRWETEKPGPRSGRSHPWDTTLPLLGF
jgi:raffinose/stachyose/melibiose transport system permease protein